MSDSVLYYSVVQVVPDLARGERINVGVVAWDAKNSEGAVRFSRQRQRLRALGVHDTSFVSEFQAWLAEAVSMPGEKLFAPSGGPVTPWSLDIMREAAAEWAGMIQLTEPHPSEGETPVQLAHEVYERVVYLRPPDSESDASRQAIRRSVARTIRTLLKDLFEGKPPVAVAVTKEVAGNIDSHLFDIVLGNGKPQSVLVTPNLADPRTIEVRRDLEAAAWSIQDVSRSDPEITFGLVRDDRARGALLARIEALSSSLPVTPLSRDDLADWVVREANRADNSTQGDEELPVDSDR